MASQIYNVDETGLHFHCLPDGIYVSSFEKSAPGQNTYDVCGLNCYFLWLLDFYIHILN